MSPKIVNYGGKPRFRRQTVFAKNLGFGVGFEYRNNTTCNNAVYHMGMLPVYLHNDIFFLTDIRGYDRLKFG